jgi:hypothetical protein
MYHWFDFKLTGIGKKFGYSLVLKRCTEKESAAIGNTQEHVSGSSINGSLIVKILVTAIVPFGRAAN